MMTFFTILFILIGANAFFMFFSLSGVSEKAGKTTKGDSNATDSKIYPIDLVSSKYKKAV
ncbi:hypothetical protein FK220_001030 [Flavobacteriaceae bacterium TP-CH-4]|uniref:Uncharacterized protein n=1 Tax=Pelagihabitans pacificus TaxID=2696054 RepID=A0A967AQZ6_9FLAO|nr:hypothetical protein [Pelagihabitans pacificus]NHF57905.1 hypothetical protein [Pelagihabitans pacificus]